ncbi:MAG: lanthionine synthetase LanC family protein [Pseudonocardiaceae bacterium]
MTTAASDAETLATGGLQWLLGLACDTRNGLVWAGTADDDEVDPTLYSGAAGIVITFLEAHRHFGDDRYADAAVRGGQAIAAAVDDTDHCSLYSGLTGMAVALRAVDELLGDAAAGAAADHALEVVRCRFDGERWSDQFELIGGNAGIALGALAAGDPDLAVLAVTP